MNMQYRPYDSKLIELMSGKGTQPAQEWVSHEDYDPETGLWDFLDGSRGFGFVIYPIPGAGEKELESLRQMFCLKETQENDTAQIINYSSDYLDPFLQAYLDQKKMENELYRTYAYRSADFIYNARNIGFPKMPDLYTPKDFYVFVTYRTNKDHYEKAISRGASPAEIDKIDKAENERILKIQKEYKNILTNVGTSTEFFAPLHLKWYLKMLTGNVDDKIWYNPDRFIYEQVFESNMGLDLSNNAELFRFGKNDVYVGTVADYPKKVDPSKTFDMLGSMLSDRNQIPAGSGVVLNIRFMDQDKLRQDIKNKISKFSIIKRGKHNKEKKAELEKLEKDLIEGNAIHDGFITFFNSRSPDKKYDIDDAKRRLLSQVQSASYKTQDETDTRVPLFMNCLPLNFHAGLNKFFDRSVWYKSSNLAIAAPWYGDIKGNSDKPKSFFFGRRSQIYSFDVINDKTDDYAVLIFGPPGKGKTFLIKGQATAEISSGGIAILNTIGHDYEMYTKVMKGAYPDVTKGYSFNPFMSLNMDYFRDESIPKEDRDDAFNAMVLKSTNLFSYMVSPNVDLSEKDRGYIGQAINKIVWDTGDKTSVDDLALAAGEFSKDIKDSLWFYTSQGPLGSIMDPRKTKFSLDNQLTSIAFSPDLDDKQLTLYYMLTFNLISNLVYSKEYRNIRKLTSFDEYHVVANNPYLSKTVCRYFRTLRKNLCEIIIGTQSVEDIYCNDYTKVLADSSSYKIIFQQKPEAISRLKEEKKLDLNNEALEKLFRSISDDKGVYSEFMLMTPKGNTVLRNIGNPMDKIINASEAWELKRVQDLEKQGYSLAQAIEMLAYPKAA